MSIRSTATPGAALAREIHGLPIVSLEWLRITAVRAEQVVEFVFSSLGMGRGGWLVTANVDFLEKAHADPALLHLYTEADLVVADGMPLLWAARLQGTPIPERVTGSDLVWRLAERAVREKRSLYLLGGAGDAGRRAAEMLLSRWPDIRIAGWASPRISSPVTPAELAPIRAELQKHRPDLVYVAFGSPKQEHLIRALRDDFPRAWMLGCGFSLSFIAGDVPRAPLWMQRVGLEWLHRLAKEPRRLFPRYVLRDLPFTLGLLGRSLRFRGKR